jgi:hypothetical protein
MVEIVTGRLIGSVSAAEVIDPGQMSMNDEPGAM